MNIIDELWYGNISPCERDFKKGSKYSELLGYIVRHEFKRLYEDNVLGKITNEQFRMLSDGYNAEQQIDIYFRYIG